MKVNIFDQFDEYRSNKRDIIALVKKIVKEEGFKLNALNIVITDNDYLKKLNKMYFKRNRATNVISFKMDELSEIYISHNKVRKIEDLYYYIIHGLLHIVGYDHRTKKENKTMEDRCLKYLEYVLTDD